MCICKYDCVAFGGPGGKCDEVAATKLSHTRDLFYLDEIDVRGLNF